jgi:hypothetical protein
MIAYSHFAYKYNLPNFIGDCAGSEGAALFGCGLLSSYLVLFIAFYKATYKKTGAKAKSAQIAAEKVTNGSGPAAGTRGSSKSKVSSHLDVFTLVLIADTVQ